MYEYTGMQIITGNLEGGDCCFYLPLFAGRISQASGKSDRIIDNLYLSRTDLEIVHTFLHRVLSSQVELEGKVGLDLAAQL